jgi:hypothetical protein
MAKTPAQKKPNTNDSDRNLEAQLWAAADKMRRHMDASEYKHVCLGLIFLKYISDAFEDKNASPETICSIPPSSQNCFPMRASTQIGTW